MRSEGKAILDTIRSEKQLSDDTRAKVKAALDSFAKSFA
jgi:F-type H+-transporting ATPase subunit alpha